MKIRYILGFCSPAILGLCLAEINRSNLDATSSFVAGQLLRATVMKVNSNKTFVAQFRQPNISGNMSNFEKLDAKTTSILEDNNCSLNAELSTVSNRHIAQNISVICGDTTYLIDGSVLDENKLTGLSDFNVNTNIYLMVIKSNQIKSK